MRSCGPSARALFAQCEAQAPYLALRKEREYAVQPPAVPAGEALRCDAAVTLLDGTAEPERLICRAWQIGQGRMPTELDDAQMRDVLAALLRQPRKRELQQVSFTLLFGGMSLAALTHLTRHRMQALVAPELLKNADYGRYVLPQSVVDCGMGEVYRAAFSGAAACAERLESMGTDETQLCYLLLSGQTVPAAATMNAGELYTFFRAAHVYARAVGDPGDRRRGAARAAQGASAAVRALRADVLHDRPLPGGQDVLRPAG